jgi:hypothetical protein
MPFKLKEFALNGGDGQRSKAPKNALQPSNRTHVETKKVEVGRFLELLAASYLWVRSSPKVS